MSFFGDLPKDIIAGLIGSLIGFIGKAIFDLLVKYQKDHLVLQLLGFPVGKILIIHSALFDESRVSYNYPSCDMISVRKISNLLESVGKKEGVDFTVAPEADYLTDQGSINPDVYNYNLILLGGPKRNKVAGEVLQKSVKPRYQMYQDSSNQNNLYDDLARQHLVSSRDKLKNIVDASTPISDIQRDKHHDEYDYGLIMSMANPLNLNYGVLIIAGIHGPGTVGAANYISDKNNLQELARRRKGNIIQEVVSVDYDLLTERVIEVSIV